ncbi:DUF2177 family protein [Patescibacteria group bacterium]|nr:DUF2177 family protein [Patescibacteria group bacterium]
MSVIQYFWTYLVTTVIFFAIDMVWLGLISVNLYREQMGDLMRQSINWYAGVGFYLIYIVGIIIFVINPALKSGSWQQALIYGALFGFFCYATYDLTNLAVINNWPLKLTFIDIAWGTILTGSVATISYLAVQKFIA